MNDQLEYIQSLEIEVESLKSKLERASPLKRLHDWFCSHAVRLALLAAALVMAAAYFAGRGGFQPLLAGLNVAGAALVLRIALCRNLPELRCDACGRDIAKPLLFALALLFGLFAGGHLTGISLLMELATALEHAALFIATILGNRYWECIRWNFTQPNGCS